MSRLALLRVATLPFGTLGALHGGVAADRARAVVAAERAVETVAAPIPDLLFSAAGPSPGDAERAKARFALLRVRRDVHARRRPKPADLDEAAPLLDASNRSRVAEYEEALDARAAAVSAFDRSWEGTVVRVRTALLGIARTPLVEHGMVLASRSLVPKVRRLARRDPAAWAHDERHTAAKVAMYVARFAAKTSPNGVFCAVAPSWIGGDATSVAGAGGVARTDVLLSLAEVRKVTSCLAIDPVVEGAVVPRPNPTLREGDGAWTYWKPASPRNPTDEEVHARVKDQPVLRAFLEEAARETHTPAALVRAVAARTGAAEDDLRGFYARLVERGILIGEIEVPRSSRRRFRDLADAAARAGTAASWIPSLRRAEDAVDSLSAQPFELRAGAMDDVTREIEALPRRRPFRADELFRVDSASALDVRLPRSILQDLQAAMSRYTALLAAMYPEEAQHRRFVSRFLSHHPSGVDVPFLDLYGILAEPGEEGEGGKPPMELPEPTPDGGAGRRVWEDLVSRARGAAPGEAVALDALPGLPEPRWAAGVLFQVAAASAEDVSAGRYRIALNAVFNGVGLALSRFAHLLQQGEAEGSVTEELRRAWSSMERPGAVLAELTFNHEARTANAGLRPILFPLEIELPGDLVSEGVSRIPLTDLTLRHDAAADRLVLRSVSRAVEVIPVVSSGVSPSGIVSALIHIGRQGMQSVGYLPGFHERSIARWPRITHGRVVLFRARWIFRGGALPGAAPGGAACSDAAFFLETARWRAAHDLPRHVFIHTSAETKPFYVDLESPVGVDLLRRAVAGLPEDGEARLVVTEMLPGPDGMWVSDAAGAYAAEFLVQMEGPAPVSSS